MCVNVNVNEEYCLRLKTNPKISYINVVNNLI